MSEVLSRKKVRLIASIPWKFQEDADATLNPRHSQPVGRMDVWYVQKLDLILKRLDELDCDQMILASTQKNIHSTLDIELCFVQSLLLVYEPQIQAQHFELKPVMLQMLQIVGQSSGLPTEDPICDSFRQQGVPEDALRLKLNAHTRMVVDAFANDMLLDKSYNEAYEILEMIANNDYQYPTTRVGTCKRATEAIELDAITSLIAQVSSLANMIKTLKGPAIVPGGALLSDSENSRSQGKEHYKAIMLKSGTQLPGVVNDTTVEEDNSDFTHRTNSGPFVEKLGIGKARPTTITLQLADHFYAHPEGKIEDVLYAYENEKCHAIGFLKSIVEGECAKFCHSNSDDDGDPFELTEAKMIEDLPTLKLKPLPLHLKYAYLGDNNTLPVVISAKTTPDQEKKLLEVLKKSKKALGWTITDIKGISPTICMYNILLRDYHGNSIEQQKRLNPIMKEVIKKEIIKWLDVGIIYLISDISWSMHGLSRMPFGLCNAPVTFQHCMMAIFSDMVEKFLEVFMDNVFVFDDTFERCLENLELVLCRCEETNLVLNWEKCHFMVCKGIILGHKILQQGIAIDKAKIEVIEKLPPPTKISKPLCALLEHSRTFNFDELCLKAFEELKKQSVTASIVIAPNWTLPFELMCDASYFVVGAVLGKMKDKVFHVIYYASRTMIDAQLNYTTIEKELLAVEFDLEIRDRKGIKNQVADHLSRLEAGNEDGNIQLIKEDFPNEQLLVATTLPWCVPDDEIQSILHHYHLAQYRGHFGGS
ncbi:Retrovirus-related Pol polyprotein from transposon opus [Gossypium australe]|uniref:Retrovirus-related Pol polyprotein from transposon opus n=1 Tax=Gossypium australe TaxID=47621 RepID=A0A5B6WQG9_9ROSI|nr:Retrovirus-related Pol polyprotein from transposon opus [Gossypium australe]